MEINRSQASGGVFLIGLAVLFITGFWWPGVLFVIGLTSIAHAVYEEDKHWTQATGGLWMIGIGLLFWLPGLLNLNFIALLLIALGLFLIFGDEARSRGWFKWDDCQFEHHGHSEKAKRSSMYHDEYGEKPKREIV